MEDRRRARMRARFNGAAARAQTGGAPVDESKAQFLERPPVIQIPQTFADVDSSEDERPALDPEKSSDSSDAAEGDESEDESTSSEDEVLGHEGGGTVEDDEFEGDEFLGS